MSTLSFLNQMKTELTSAECDALIDLILHSPNRINDKTSEELGVSFRTIRKKLGLHADKLDGIPNGVNVPYPVDKVSTGRVGKDMDLL